MGLKMPFLKVCLKSFCFGSCCHRQGSLTAKGSECFPKMILRRMWVSSFMELENQ